MISRQTIDEIMQTAQVEEVIGDFVHLKKAGANYKAKSPFVDERTPSFMVSPAKQIWKCFSSGKGGNAVSFLMEHEHFSYVEALKWLGAKYNIAIREDREKTSEEIASDAIRENLSIVNAFANDHFVHNLHHHVQGKAIGLSYFLERGFDLPTIQQFQLGYCLDESDGFTREARAKGYKQDYLEKAGLTKTKDGRSFDFFRGRVMFPIHSIAGKVLGFGGRTLQSDKKIAKYFNSPESPLYNKSKILYGLYFAKQAIIKADRCYLVEGYTDVVRLHQSGIKNVVASSGTALTVDQVKLIKRYSSHITILYDGDTAGIKASFRGIDLVLSQGMNVKVVLFPDGEDPDSYAKKSSPAVLENYIADHSKDFILFKSDVLLKGVAHDPIKRAEVINDIVRSIAVIEDGIKRQLYCRECSGIFEIDEATIIQSVDRERFKQQSRRQRPVPRADQRTPTTDQEDTDGQAGASALENATIAERLNAQEYDIVRLLLHYGTFMVKANHLSEDDSGKAQVEQVEVSVAELIVHELTKDEMVFEHPIYRQIYQQFKSGIEKGEIYQTRFFTHHENQEIAHTSAHIIANHYEISPYWGDKNVHVTTELDKLDLAVKQAIYSYKTTSIRKEKEQIQATVKRLHEQDETQHYDEIMTLLARQRELDHVIGLLTNNDSLARVIH